MSEVAGVLAGKRKFTIAWLTLGMSFVLALFDKLDSGGWVAVAGLVVGLFGFANAAVHVAKARNGGGGGE